jgi:biotin-(acetyl-CoA carboxylase) ligase
MAALAHAQALAAEHGPGLLTWAPGEIQAEAAVVLEPRDLSDALLARFCAANALADALAAHAPPELELGFHWPGELRLNGGRCGAVQSAPGPEGLHLVGFTLRLTLPERPGRDETCLAEEGTEPVPGEELVASWARHLMAGLDEWQARGWQRMAERYLARLLHPAPEAGLRRGLDPASGALVLERDGVRETLPC